MGFSTPCPRRPSPNAGTAEHPDALVSPAEPTDLSVTPDPAPPGAYRAPDGRAASTPAGHSPAPSPAFRRADEHDVLPLAGTRLAGVIPRMLPEY